MRYQVIILRLTNSLLWANTSRWVYAEGMRGGGRGEGESEREADATVCEGQRGLHRPAAERDLPVAPQRCVYGPVLQHTCSGLELQVLADPRGI